VRKAALSKSFGGLPTPTTTTDQMAQQQCQSSDECWKTAKVMDFLMPK